jgi:16S rRNA (cytosine967-C5)-methyltransferase
LKAVVQRRHSLAGRERRSERNPVLVLAERAIARSGPRGRADVALRELLKVSRFSQREAAEASRAVFSYFRWLGWLKPHNPVDQQLRHALELADQFAGNPQQSSLEELRARAVPGWVEKEMEIRARWLRSLQTEPRIWLRAKAGTGPALAQALGHCRIFGEGQLADVLEYSGAEDLFRTPQFQRGEFELQDLSSQAVGLICRPAPGETWWDVCAGEGGKMLHLSELMENRGLIWATDRVPWRLNKLRHRAARARVFNYRTALWDGASECPIRTRFDGVLIDAPCSGLGTWQRNPHARWTTKSSDVLELAEVQLRLLTQAASAVKPGGKLIYSVCTLTRSETEDVARKVEAEVPAFEPLGFSNPLDPSNSPVAQLTLWPQQFGCNGMFIAAWKRTHS